MPFTVEIRGVAVSCSTIDELERLLAYALNDVPGVVKKVNGVWMGYVTAVREALGAPKPDDAEWTWEHAIAITKQVREMAGIAVGDRGGIIRTKPEARLPLGKLAEQMVYSITTGFAGLPALDAAWQSIPQMRRAEIVTIWIELVEARLKAEIK